MIIWLRKNIYIISLSVLFALTLVLNEVARSHWSAIAVMSVLTALAGFHIFKKAVMDLRYRVIGIDLLVTIAVIAAFVIGDYFEAAAVTYLFTLGHVLEKKSLEKTRSALKSLMDLKPSMARVLTDEGEKLIALEEVRVDDILIVKPGEKIPTDGLILEGTVLIDEQMMTGESVPVEKTIGATVFGSTILKTGYIRMKATHVGDDTTLARIIHMVEEAQDKKAPTQRFMERFSKYYTPLVVLIAIVILIVTRDVRLAVTMLVIACPGALVIATPVSFVAGIGNAARKGILFKGGDSIERLSRGNVVFFDKTGTLTKGRPELKKIKTYRQNEDTLLKIAGIGESYSEHPLAAAIIEAARERKLLNGEKPDRSEFTIGKGISFEYKGQSYALGSRKHVFITLSDEVSNDIDACENDGMTTLVLTSENDVLAIFGIADALRPHADQLIASLKGLGVKKTIMLTGDQEAVARNVANNLGLDAYHAGLMPSDKATIVTEYQKNHHTIFVGDGINDAVALSRAEASVAVGGLGKDLAMETADVVLMGEDILKLKDAIKISHKVKANMAENIIFALLVVLVLMSGVIFGLVTMSIGMLVHELSVLLVLVNAIRLLRYDIGGRHGARSKNS